MARGGIEAPDEGWQRLWTVNVMSHVYASRAMIPRMVDRGGWCLADNGVRSGAVEPDRVDAGLAVSKHAAVGLAEFLSIAYGDRGIMVFALCPQAVRTGMTTAESSAAAAMG